MSARKSHEAYMDHEKRLTIVESAILNINTSLIDIKQDLRRQSDKIDNLDKKIDAKLDILDKKIDTKFDTLDKKIDTKFDTLDKKIDTKFDTLDKKIDSRFDILSNRMWSNFLWLMGVIIGLAGLVAHSQHWI